MIGNGEPGECLGAPASGLPAHSLDGVRLLIANASPASLLGDELEDVQLGDAAEVGAAHVQGPVDQSG